MPRCRHHAAATPSAVFACIPGRRDPAGRAQHCAPLPSIAFSFAHSLTFGSGGAAEFLIQFCDPIINHGLHLGRKRLMQPDKIKIDVSAGLPRNTCHCVGCYVCLIGRRFWRLDDRLHGLNTEAQRMKALYQVSSGKKPSGYCSFIECIKLWKFFWFPQLTEYGSPFQAFRYLARSVFEKRLLFGVSSAKRRFSSHRNEAPSSAAP